MASSTGYFGGYFTPDNAELLAAPASKRKFNGVPVIWMDKENGRQSPVPEAYWSGFLPGPATAGYSGTTGLKVNIVWFCPTGVVTGNARFAAAFDLKGATDVPSGAASFAAYGATNEIATATAVNATALGVAYTQCAVVIAKVQNGQSTAPAIADFFRLRVRRTVESALDTLSAPICILGVNLLDY